MPHGDPVYYEARPKIAVPSDQLLVKDGMFGLHPALAPLVPLWKSGKMAAVHATGLPVPNRSHFSAMEEVEDADPGSNARVGWLNRLVGRDGVGSPLEAIQMGGGVPPTAAVRAAAGAGHAERRRGPAGRCRPGRPRRPPPAVAADCLGHHQRRAGHRAAVRARRRRRLRAGSCRVGDPGERGGLPTNNDLAEALKSSARTIRANVGAEIITVDHGSWDHHTNIGTTAGGNMKSRTDEFAGAIAAFFADLGPLADKVTLVTISEFGRRVVENANQGLDHGYGNVMFVMGAGVKGGRYYGNWPGLTKTTDADLLVTTDYRSVLSEVIVSRFDASPAEIFPGMTRSPWV